MKSLIVRLALGILLIPAIGIAQEVSKSGNNWYVINSNASGKITIGTTGAQPVELLVNQAGTSPKGFRVNGTTGNLEGIAGTEGITTGLFGNGTVGAPSIAFQSDADGTGTGFYRAGANNPRLAINGVDFFSVAPSGTFILAEELYVPDGSAGAPSYTFNNDANTGMYSSGADTIGFATGGTRRVEVTGSGLLLQTGSILINQFGAVGTPSYTFSSDTDLGLYRASADVLGVSAGGALVASFGSFGLAMGTSQVVSTPLGTAGAPSYANTSVAGTGMYFPTTTSIGFSSGSTKRVDINSGGLDVTGELSVSGTTTASGVVCVKADGDYGQCTSVVGAGGTCTCA